VRYKVSHPYNKANYSKNKREEAIPIHTSIGGGTRDPGPAVAHFAHPLHCHSQKTS
jgi:hypothetical protein